MKDALLKMKDQILEFLGNSNKKTKNSRYQCSGYNSYYRLAIVTILSTRTTLVPLYSNLTPSETGLIKENLDSKGCPKCHIK